MKQASMIPRRALAHRLTGADGVGTAIIPLKTSAQTRDTTAQTIPERMQIT
jgi:hypothetical protein